MLLQAILFYIKIFIYFYIKPEHLEDAFYSPGGCMFDMPVPHFYICMNCDN